MAVTHPAETGVRSTESDDLDELKSTIADLRARLAAAEAELAQQRLTRLGLIVRLIRRAYKYRYRRRTLLRDVARAFVDLRLPLTPESGNAKKGRRGTAYPIPQASIPNGPIARPDLRVAVILDPFSELAFQFEWQQVTFGPEDWRPLLEAEPPHLLFVESAWNGNNGRWRLHMTRDSQPSPELRELVAWCRENRIPTVFWNKEDPPNYSKFIETAKLFDQVFTVDADRIPHYHRDLDHSRIDLLPFAAQPRIHNPIQRAAGRVYDVAFAGTYFADKHEHRRSQMSSVLEPALEYGLHIYSRMQGKDERYQFPERFRPNIVGSLPYEEMLAAYTSYKVFLNVNSVIASATMCSRRLFELSAAQTSVVTAPAASIEPFFGDTLTVTNDPDETRRKLNMLLRHEEYRERLALRAHRRVYDEHLYGHRVDSVLEAVDLPVQRIEPTISVVVPTYRPAQLEEILTFVGRQSHPRIQLVLVTHGFAQPNKYLGSQAKEMGIEDVVVRSADSSSTLGECMNFGVDAADGDYIAKMDDDNWYGTHYLRDMIRAFSYSEATVVGKWAHFVHHASSKATLLRFPDSEHRYVTLVQGGTILVPRSVAEKVRFEDVPRRIDTTFLEKIRSAGGKIYSVDRFNFVSIRRADPTSHTWQITEEEMLTKKSRLLFYGEAYAHAEV